MTVQAENPEQCDTDSAEDDKDIKQAFKFLCHYDFRIFFEREVSLALGSVTSLLKKYYAGNSCK